MLIIPSILVTSKQEFLKQIKSVQKILNQIQLDVADGKFVPVKTWADPDIIEKNCQINVELHLMVEKPLFELQKWTALKNINRVLIHLESQNIKEAIKFAKNNGWQVGLVLNPETELNILEKYLDKIDCVVFMGVYPGKQGQKLIPEVLEKIKKITSSNPTILTELDGGVNEKTLPDIIESGVKAVCPGSAIFGNERTPGENVDRMQEMINSLTS